MIRFVAFTAAVVAVIAMTNGSLLTSAQSGPIVSVDAVSDGGNTATTVGPIDSSLSPVCGATFNVDIVIQGVTNIAGFQADLLYNPAVLKVTAVGYDFLLTTTGASVVNVGNSVPDTDGNFRLAAAMFSTTPITGAAGEGVLARITFQVTGAGSSVLDLTSMKLADASAAPIPPSDGNGFYIGPVNDASIVVNLPCSDAVPVGGIAELPNIATTPVETPDTSGTNVGFPAAAAAAAGVGALTLGGAAWYAVKRRLR